MTTEKFFSDSQIPHHLEPILAEDPLALLPAIAKLNATLTQKENDDYCLRKVEFLVFGLIDQCDGLREADRLNVLNDFFFDHLKINILAHSPQQIEDLMLDHLLTHRRANSLLASLLYVYFSTRIEVPIYLINLNTHGLLKWVDGNTPKFIDLHDSGKILNSSTSLHLLNNHCQIDKEHCLDIIPLKQAFLKYMKCLIKLYEETQRTYQLKICLDYLLYIEKNDVSALGKRALVNLRLNQEDAALCDLKRYLSFVNYTSAPHEIKIAFEGLVANKQFLEDTNILLH